MQIIISPSNTKLINYNQHKISIYISLDYTRPNSFNLFPTYINLLRNMIHKKRLPKQAAFIT